MTDWAEPLILARDWLKRADLSLSLAGPLNDDLSNRMRVQAERELCEARAAINDALASVRAGR